MNIFFKFINVFILVGIGQFIAIWFVGFAAETLSPEAVMSIAKFDSAMMFAMAACSLGIGQYFPRYLMKDDTYKTSLNDARIIRFLVGVVLAVFGGILLVFDYIEYGMVFISAPFLFCGIEYSLYVRNRQVTAAICSLLRVSGVYITIFLVVYFSTFNNISITTLYFLLSIIFSVLASLISLLVLKQGFIPEFRLPDAQVLRGVSQLGGAFFVYNIFKSLLIPIGSLALTDKEVVDLFIFLKLYLLIFSIRRVYVQIAHQWLKNEQKSVQINLLFFTGAILGIFIYSILYFYFDFEVFSDVLGLTVKNIPLVLILLLSLAVFSVYPTRLLLLEGDGAYKNILVYLGSIFIVLILPTVFFAGLNYLMGLVVVFEFSIGFLCFLAVKKISNDPALSVSRLI